MDLAGGRAMTGIRGYKSLGLPRLSESREAARMLFPIRVIRVIRGCHFGRGGSEAAGGWAGLGRW